MKNILYTLLVTIALAGAQSCIEDEFTDSPSDQPYFSVETLDFGTVFTGEATPTRRFLIHNPHSKSLSISDIHLSGDDASCFRLNVDGISGDTFSGVDIRGKDSIFVFVAATFPEREASAPTTQHRSTSSPTASPGRSLSQPTGLMWCDSRP